MRRIISVLLVLVLSLNVASPLYAQSSALPQEEPETSQDTDPPSEASPEEPNKALTSVECQLLGKQDGKDMSAGGSFVGGLAAGVLLGLIGTGIAYVAAGPSDPPADKVHGLESDYCRLVYTDAYRSAAKGKKRSQALLGGLLGTAAFVVIYMAASSSD